MPDDSKAAVFSTMGQSLQLEQEMEMYEHLTGGFLVMWVMFQAV